jgi:hypothetical protein
VYRELFCHLTPEHSSDDLGYLSEQLRVLEDTEPETRFARYYEDNVAVSYLWEALNKVGSKLLSSAFHTRWADSAFA